MQLEPQYIGQSRVYNITSIMTFGGEPLLYPEITCRIHKKAYELNIPSRQIITNAYWTKDINKIERTVRMLKESYVNNICISVDAFHQKYLPFDHVKETVKKFIEQKFDIIKLNPCWIDCPEGDNEYDDKTRKIINEISELGIGTTEGNIMSPNGNSITNFPDNFKRKLNFFGMNCTDIPYSDYPNNIESICLNSDCSVSICNGEKYTVPDFIYNYDPYKEKGLASVISGGIDLLIEEAKKENVLCDPRGYFSLCALCTDLRKRMIK